MSYTLEAVLARQEVLTPAPVWIADSSVITLDQGVGMIPITHALIDSLSGTGEEQDAIYEAHGFHGFKTSFMAVLMDLSHRGPVGYIEVDYFGGVGEQRVVLWDKGQVVLIREKQGIGPVNELLQNLGVFKGKQFDEFEAVGLERKRNTQAWLGHD